MNLKLDKLPLDHSGDLGDLLTVFAAPKRIGLKSYGRLFGIAGKIMVDYVIRRFDAPSALLKSGLDLRWDTA
jgi:hypothetical protein